MTLLGRNIGRWKTKTLRDGRFSGIVQRLDPEDTLYLNCRPGAAASMNPALI